MWTHRSNLFLISDPICLWSGTVLTLVVSNKQEKDSIYKSNQPLVISSLDAVQIKENLHLSRIVYLKEKKKLFARASGSLGSLCESHCFITPVSCFAHIPRTQLFLTYFNRLGTLFWPFHCFILAACNVCDTVFWAYSSFEFTGSRSGKECLLNAQNVIPTLSVVSAALFRLEFCL